MNIMQYLGSLNEPERFQQQPQQPMMNHPQGGNIMGSGELEDDPMPKPPNPYMTVGDPSAMGSYGMEAPPLPNPMTEMNNIMQLASTMHTPQQQRQPQPQVNLMSYLQKLIGG